MREPGTRPSAADVAAQQVEGILAAAEAAAEELKRAARQDAEELRATGRREASRELELARKKAIELDADARQEAKRMVDEATKESAQIREQTRRQVEGRVAEADAAATQVLEEARTLSSGLRQLGSTLQSQGERILRDVQGAHKRMQADLRVGPLDDELSVRPARVRTRGLETRSLAEEPAERGDDRTRATPEERAAIERAAAELAADDQGPRPRPRRQVRANPFDDLDVPSWIER